MKKEDAITMKNKEGYNDPTACNAINNADKSASDNPEYETFRKLLFTIFNICELSGFRLDGRVKLVNKFSGNIYE